MNGYWLPEYSARPTQFVALWNKFRASLKKNAPNTLMIWAPNAGNNYPWGMTLDSAQAAPTNANAADRAALDTNKDGKLVRI